MLALSVPSGVVVLGGSRVSALFPTGLTTTRGIPSLLARVQFWLFVTLLVWLLALRQPHRSR